MQTTRLPPSHTAGRERTRLREGTALLRVPARLHRPKRHPPPQLNSFHLTDSDLAAGTLAAGDVCSPHAGSDAWGTLPTPSSRLRVAPQQGARRASISPPVPRTPLRDAPRV